MKKLIEMESKNLQVTSRDIAKLLNKNHGDVLRDIRSEAEKCGIKIKESNSYFALCSYKVNNRERKQYLLTEKGILLIGARYDSKVRLALIDKLTSLDNMDKKVRDIVKDSEDLLKSVRNSQMNRKKTTDTAAIRNTKKRVS